MRGEDAGVGSAAARARDLQPPGEPDVRALGAPVSAEDLHQMDRQHDREARQMQRAIDRHMGDKQLLDLLAEDGFEGRQYDRFIEELVRYGISVLRGWMHSGFIFKLVASRGFGLNPHELELEELALDSDLREELATMTVARALPRFRQRAFLEGGWSHTGGASITTYFMGACAYDFPNEFRRHRASQERQHRSLARQKAVYEGEVSSRKIADEVVGNLWVTESIADIDDPKAQAAVALTLDGYSQEEIKELLNATSVRAIEGLLYRWRRKAKREEEK